MKMRFLSKRYDELCYFYTCTKHIYNPILNIKAVMCMKRHTNYWTPLHKHTSGLKKSWIYSIFRVLNFSITHGNRQFKYQTLISCNKNAVYKGYHTNFVIRGFFRLGWWTTMIIKFVFAVSPLRLSTTTYYWNNLHQLYCCLPLVTVYTVRV